jgi:molybdopterin converting factor small subunit
MIIEVLLFAAARELTGRDAVKVEVSPPTQHGKAGAGISISDKRESAGNENAACVLVSCIMQALTQQCPELKPLLPSCRIAVDCEYVGPDTSVPAGAEIALIPPVSGG